MKAKQRLEVIWEKHETTTISFNRSRRSKVYCQGCESNELHLTVSEAAVVLQITAREVCRLTEAGEIHYLETDGGALLICGNSLQSRRTKASDKFE